MVEVFNFWYNGIFGRTRHGKAPYTASFIRWTEDPGVALFLCSDGKKRRIPLFAIVGPLPASWPKQLIEDDGGLYVGPPCES